MRVHEMELLPSARAGHTENVMMRFDDDLMTSLSHALLYSPPLFAQLSVTQCVVAAGDHGLVFPFSCLLLLRVSMEKRNAADDILRASSCLTSN